jgi:hypothetical protein
MLGQRVKCNRRLTAGAHGIAEAIPGLEHMCRFVRRIQAGGGQAGGGNMPGAAALASAGHLDAQAFPVESTQRIERRG